MIVTAVTTALALVVLYGAVSVREPHHAPVDRQKGDQGTTGGHTRTHDAQIITFGHGQAGGEYYDVKGLVDDSVESVMSAFMGRHVETLRPRALNHRPVTFGQFVAAFVPPGAHPGPSLPSTANRHTEPLVPDGGHSLVAPSHSKQVHKAAEDDYRGQLAHHDATRAVYRRSMPSQGGHL